MERLTKYICERAHGAEGVSENKLTGSYCRGQFEATALVERLSNIEDILGDTYDLDRLRELVEADKGGRCVMLPCKYGERVYCVYHKREEHFGCAHCLARYGMGVVCDYYNDEADDCTNSPEKYKNYEIISKHFAAGMIPDFGKTVFKSSKDAESACERLEKELKRLHEN